MDKKSFINDISLFKYRENKMIQGGNVVDNFNFSITTSTYIDGEFTSTSSSIKMKCKHFNDNGSYLEKTIYVDESNMVKLLNFLKTGNQNIFFIGREWYDKQSIDHNIYCLNDSEFNKLVFYIKVNNGTSIDTYILFYIPYSELEFIKMKLESFFNNYMIMTSIYQSTAQTLKMIDNIKEDTSTIKDNLRKNLPILGYINTTISDVSKGFISTDMHEENDIIPENVESETSTDDTEENNNYEFEAEKLDDIENTSINQDEFFNSIQKDFSNLSEHDISNIDVKVDIDEISNEKTEEIPVIEDQKNETFKTIEDESHMKNKNILSHFKNFKDLVTMINIASSHESPQYKFIEMIYDLFVVEYPDYTFESFVKSIFGISVDELYYKLSITDSTFKKHADNLVDNLEKIKDNMIGNTSVFTINNTELNSATVNILNYVGIPNIFNINVNNNSASMIYNNIDNPALNVITKISYQILTIESVLYYYIFMNAVPQNFTNQFELLGIPKDDSKSMHSVYLCLLNIIQTTSSFVFMTIPLKEDMLLTYPEKTNGTYQFYEEYERYVDMVEYIHTLFKSNYFVKNDDENLDEYKYIGHMFKNININNETFLNENYYGIWKFCLFHVYYLLHQTNNSNGYYLDIISQKGSLLTTAIQNVVQKYVTEENCELFSNIVNISKYCYNSNHFLHILKVNDMNITSIPKEVLLYFKYWDAIDYDQNNIFNLISKCNELKDDINIVTFDQKDIDNASIGNKIIN